MEMTIEEKILAQINLAEKIVITSHKSPDGDSIGSSMALFHFLKKLNKEVSICHPDPAPKYLQWIPNSNEIITFEENASQVKEKFESADLIFALDYNDASRLGEEMGKLFTETNTFKIMIDHHLKPSDFVDLSLSDTSSCSTCQLIFQVIENSGNINLLDAAIGTPLYTGLVTDSGSFRFNSVNAYTHHVAGYLIRVGVQNDSVHEQLFDLNTVDKLKLRAFATSEKLVVLTELQTAYISLSEDELNQFKHDKGDTEGLVNVALSLEGIQIAAFFAEKEGKIKISFRSKGRNHPVNEFAGKFFSGGGHANAAGGIFDGKLEDAIALFTKNIHQYVA